MVKGQRRSSRPPVLASWPPRAVICFGTLVFRLSFRSSSKKQLKIHQHLFFASRPAPLSRIVPLPKDHLGMSTEVSKLSQAFPHLSPFAKLGVDEKEKHKRGKRQMVVEFANKKSTHAKYAATVRVHCFLGFSYSTRTTTTLRPSFPPPSPPSLV